MDTSIAIPHAATATNGTAGSAVVEVTGGGVLLHAPAVAEYYVFRNPLRARIRVRALALAC
jgi:hypothetical protein